MVPVALKGQLESAETAQTSNFRYRSAVFMLFRNDLN